MTALTTRHRESHLLALALSRSSATLARQLIEPMSEMLGVSVCARIIVTLPHEDLDTFMELAKQAYSTNIPFGPGVLLARHEYRLQWLGVDIEMRWTGALTEDQRAEILDQCVANFDRTRRTA